jgi:hypothetical protein
MVCLAVFVDKKGPYRQLDAGDKVLLLVTDYSTRTAKSGVNH